VASLDDLARLKRRSPDLEGAVRLHALVASPMAREDRASQSTSNVPVERLLRDGLAPQWTREELTEPVDADPEPNGRIDRILGKLANVDAFLTEVNRGERALRFKKR
jgi:hypothetical protein